MSWDIEHITNEETWTANALEAVVASMPDPLPPREQKIGASTVEWWEATPGVAVIMAFEGSVDDRALAEQIVKLHLGAHGYRRAQFNFDEQPAQGQVIDQSGRPVGQDEQTPTPIRLHYGDETVEGEVLGFRQMRNGEWEVRIRELAIIDANGRTELNPPQITNVPQANIDAGSPQVEIMGDNRPNQLGGSSPQLPSALSSLLRQSSWSDIMNKAKRLIQSGQVTILRNGYNVVASHVIGDHGEYNTEIGRDDPNSRAITTWTCECPWDQYAFQRTRQWKKYEGRPCAHVLATYWKSLGTPLDDYNPEEHGPIGTGQKLGPPPGPGAISPLKGEIPETPGPPQGPRVPTGPHVFSPEDEAPQATGGPPGPAQAPLAPPPGAPGVLPPSPMDQLQMMQPPMPGQTPAGMPAPPNSVSVPGARLPSPFNPIQYPGGTYSRTAAEFNPPEIVRLKNDVYGVAVGKSDQHGNGQYQPVPAINPSTGQPQTAEVLGQDETTGWVEIIVPLDDSGPLEPYHVQCFVEPSDIEHTRVRPPGPFIRRRQ